jgi:uncharacterized protein YcfL
MRRFLLLGGVALLALLVAACGSSSTTGTSTTQQPTVTLEATTFATNAITGKSPRIGSSHEMRNEIGEGKEAL